MFFIRSGFFLFCSEYRPKIKGQNPSLGIGEVAKKLGTMWNNMTDANKQPYLAKAGKLKDKYKKVTWEQFVPVCVIWCLDGLAEQSVSLQDVADYKHKGKTGGATASKPASKTMQDDDDEEEEEEEEEDEEDEDDDDE